MGNTQSQPEGDPDGESRSKRGYSTPPPGTGRYADIGNDLGSESANNSPIAPFSPSSGRGTNEGQTNKNEAAPASSPRSPDSTDAFPVQLKYRNKKKDKSRKSKEGPTTETLPDEPSATSLTSGRLLADEAAEPSPDSRLSKAERKALKKKRKLEAAAALSVTRSDPVDTPASPDPVTLASTVVSDLARAPTTEPDIAAPDAAPSESHASKKGKSKKNKKKRDSRAEINDNENRQQSPVLLSANGIDATREEDRPMTRDQDKSWSTTPGDEHGERDSSVAAEDTLFDLLARKDASDLSPSKQGGKKQKRDKDKREETVIGETRSQVAQFRAPAESTITEEEVPTTQDDATTPQMPDSPLLSKKRRRRRSGHKRKDHDDLPLPENEVQAEESAEQGLAEKEQHPPQLDQALHSTSLGVGLPEDEVSESAEQDLAEQHPSQRDQALHSTSARVPRPEDEEFPLGPVAFAFITDIPVDSEEKPPEDAPFEPVPAAGDQDAMDIDSPGPEDEPQMNGGSEDEHLEEESAEDRTDEDDPMDEDVDGASEYSPDLAEELEAEEPVDGSESEQPAEELDGDPVEEPGEHSDEHSDEEPAEQEDAQPDTQPDDHPDEGESTKPANHDIGEAASAPASAAKTPDPHRGVGDAPTRKASRNVRRMKRSYLDRREEETAKAFEALPAEEVVASIQKEAASRKKRARPRKTQTSPAPASAAADGADAQDDGGGDDLPAEGPQPKVKRVFTTGVYSAEELRKISEAVEAFREEKGLRQAEVNSLMHGRPDEDGTDNAKELWALICSACPDRARQSLICRCRKMFHNYTGRGVFTPEQDQELRDLVQAKGPKWSVIGKLVNRHPEDLRDRWRNYLVCGDKKKVDFWVEEEEAALVGHVMDAIKVIQESRGQPSEGIAESAERDVPWDNISKEMNRTRSAKQCRQKWQLLRARELGDGDEETANTGGGRGRIDQALEKARSDLRRMQPKDKRQLILAIRASMAPTDDDIPWPRLGNKRFRSQWSRESLRLMWARLRNSVPNDDIMTTHAVTQELLEGFREDGVFTQLEDSEVDEEAESSLVKASAVKKRKRYPRTPREWAISRRARRMPGSSSQLEQEAEGTAATPSKQKRSAKSGGSERQDDGSDDDEDIEGGQFEESDEPAGVEPTKKRKLGSTPKNGTATTVEVPSTAKKGASSRGSANRHRTDADDDDTIPSTQISRLSARQARLTAALPRTPRRRTSTKFLSQEFVYDSDDDTETEEPQKSTDKRRPRSDEIPASPDLAPVQLTNNTTGSSKVRTGATLNGFGASLPHGALDDDEDEENSDVDDEDLNVDTESMDLSLDPKPRGESSADRSEDGADESAPLTESVEGDEVETTAVPPPRSTASNKRSARLPRYQTQLPAQWSRAAPPVQPADDEASPPPVSSSRPPRRAPSPAPSLGHTSDSDLSTALTLDKFKKKGPTGPTAAKNDDVAEEAEEDDDSAAAVSRNKGKENKPLNAPPPPPPEAPATVKAKKLQGTSSASKATTKKPRTPFISAAATRQKKRTAGAAYDDIEDGNPSPKRQRKEPKEQHPQQQSKAPEPQEEEGEEEGPRRWFLSQSQSESRSQQLPGTNKPTTPHLALAAATAVAAPATHPRSSRRQPGASAPPPAKKSGLARPVVEPATDAAAAPSGSSKQAKTKQSTSKSSSSSKKATPSSASASAPHPNAAAARGHRGHESLSALELVAMMEDGEMDMVADADERRRMLELESEDDSDMDDVLAVIPPVLPIPTAAGASSSSSTKKKKKRF